MGRIFYFSCLADDSVSDIGGRLKSQLANKGIEWREGKPRLLGIEDCESFLHIFGNCFGNNPAAPYVGLMVPSLEGEFEDPFYGKSVLFPGATDNLSLTYRMGVEEAILILGESPPRGAFFSSQTYLFSRPGEAGPAPLWFSLLPGDLAEKLFVQTPNSQRFLSFSSMGDSINNVVMARGMGTPSGFGERFYIILTSSQTTAAALRNELVKAGASAERIFVEKIPDYIRMGLGEGADDLATLLRYSLPENVSLGQKWRTELPLSVVRLTPSSIGRPARFPRNTLEKRTANSETSLFLARSQLLSWVQKTLGVEGSRTLSFSSELAGLTGVTCVERNMNCLGDTRDTDSYRFANVGSVLGNEIVLTLGVNHTRTGNATYVSLSINDTEISQGVGSVSQTGPAAGFVQGELNDSLETFAKFYGKSLPVLLRGIQEKFYLRIVARNCQGLPLCTEFTESQVPLDSDVSFIQRAYLKPGSSVGPDWTKLLSPVFLKANRNSIRTR